MIFLVTAGKPYYLGGMYPTLFAAGADPTLRWVRAAGAPRRTILGVAVALSAAVSAVVALPIVPASVLHTTPIVAMNYDAGEQVGWPRFVDTVAGAFHALPATQRGRAIVLTSNYGEADAVLRYDPGIHRVYSGHNSLWDLGPPPAETDTAIAIGYPESDLRTWFATVRPVATIDNGVDLDNDEQGRTVWLCTGPTASGATLWPKMRRLG